MKKMKHFYGVSLLTAVCLAACTPENAFEPSSGNMKSSIAFAVGVDEDNGNATRSAEPESFVVDSFVVDNQTVYLTCTVTDLSGEVDEEEVMATEPSATRGTPIYTSTSAATEGNAKIFNLESVYGHFNVSAFLDGDVTKPLKQNDKDITDPSTTDPFINIPYKFEAYEYTDKHTRYEYWVADDSRAEKYFWWQDAKNTANDYKLTFFAYAPTTSVISGNTWSGLTASNFKANGCIEFDYTVPKAESGFTDRDAEAQPDILVTSTGATPLSRPAAQKIYENSVQSSDEYYVVPLTFYHALCGVRFKVGDFATVMAGSSIESITLSNLQNTGKCKFNPAATPKFTWTPNDASRKGTYKQTFGEGTLGTGSSDIKKDDMAFKANNQKTFMLIPQSFSNTSTDEVAITIRFSKGGIIDERISKLKNYTWLPGKLYTYTFETKAGGVKLAVSDKIDKANMKKNTLVIKNDDTATAYVRVALAANWVSNDSGKPSIPYDPTTWDTDLATTGALNTTDWTAGGDGFYYYKHPLLGGHTILPANTLFGEIKFTETAPYSGCHLEVMVVTQAVRATQVEDAWGSGIKSTMGLDTTIKD